MYKRVKAVAEFCPKCGERLIGNNSRAHPWECACGVWKARYGEDGFFRATYIIEPKDIEVPVHPNPSNE